MKQTIEMNHNMKPHLEGGEGGLFYKGGRRFELGITENKSS